MHPPWYVIVVYVKTILIGEFDKGIPKILDGDHCPIKSFWLLLNWKSVGWLVEVWLVVADDVEVTAAIAAYLSVKYCWFVIFDIKLIIIVEEMFES